MPFDLQNPAVGASAISVLVENWFAENTYHSNEFTELDQLVGLKDNQNLTISLAMPALNEEEAVANVILTLKSALGETDWNLEDRWQGKADVQLNSSGCEQAAQIAQKLKT